MEWISPGDERYNREYSLQYCNSVAWRPMCKHMGKHNVT